VFDGLVRNRGRRPIPSLIATGLLVLSPAVLGACGEPDATLAHGRAGLGQPSTPPPPPVAVTREADEQVADPVRIRVPAIGVDAPVEPLELDANGVLPAPATADGTGWWVDGPEPGERGPAVIVGHLDSHRGPAVFFRLADLGIGEEILVDRADATTAVFIARRIAQHAKDAFPTEAVYSDTPDAQLRLVTCAGDFDGEQRRYLDNVVVHAERAG
jgi:sortase (surface protein transpeptidase)